MSPKGDVLMIRLTAIHKEALRAEAERLECSMNALIECWIEHHCRKRSAELRQFIKLRAKFDAMRK
jgi:hypothetical protein